MTESELDSLLALWGRYYGESGVYRSGGVGDHILARLMAHQGFIPTAKYVASNDLTPADRVELAVTGMRKIECRDPVNPYTRASFVLIAEYCTPRRWPESERLRYCRDLGHDISRHTYYRCLQFGRAYLMGHLHRSTEEKLPA